MEYKHSNISNCSFLNSINTGGFHGPGGALHIQNSNVLLTGNVFQNNSADVGGVLFVYKSTLTVTNDTFQYNSVDDGSGGVLYVENSVLTVTDNIFQNNTADYGGVLFVYKSTLTVTNNTFQYNSAIDDATGGVLYAENSILTVTDNIFQNNTADYGGVLFVVDGNLTVTGNTFQNNSARANGGVLEAEDSNLTVTDNIFQNNTADYGGVLFVYKSTLAVTNNTFQYNSAIDDATGGVLCVENSTLTVTENIFQNNSAGFGGVFAVWSSNLTVTGNRFQNNCAVGGGVLSVEDSNLTVTGNTFQNNSAISWGGVLQVGGGNLTITANIFHSGYGAGVLFVADTTLTITDNAFQNNTAEFSGAVLEVGSSNLTLTDNIFQSNAVGFDGGVLDVDDSTLTVTNNTFQHNSATRYGGVLQLHHSNLTVTNNTFQHNSADYGGVLEVSSSNLTVSDNTFQHNSAAYGGVLRVTDSSLTSTVTDNTFQNNSVTSHGGVLYVQYSILTVVGNTFQNNSAGIGGVLYITCSFLNLIGNIFKKNAGIALGGAIFVDGQCVYQHTFKIIVRMYENNIIENNRAEYGGGIAALDISRLELGNTTIKNCTARYGGGLYVHNTKITGNVTITSNSATEGGGGMYASSSTIKFTGNTTVINNLAVDGNGGGLLLSGGSQFYLQPEAHVYFISNSAENTGGAIKVEEKNPLIYCIHSEFNLSTSNDCFFQPLKVDVACSSPDDLKTIINGFKVGIYFDNNSAEAGADLYGGSVDNCIVSNIDTINCPSCSSGDVFDDIIISESTPDISSDPLYICTCRDNQTNCSGSYHPEPVYPGGTLEVSVTVHGQRNGTTPAVIQIINTSNSNITIQENENIQNIRSICTTLKYTIQSFKENTIQDMTLYAQGPCLPTISNTLRLYVKILHCPSGFQLSNTQPMCICTKRLQQFTNSCLVDSRTIHRMQYAEFWVGYDNNSDGVILHPHCPFDYCTSEEMYLAVDDSDKQCNYNRTGLLCGRCSGNLSLALGSSRCLQCSCSYLSLLAALSFAGIALVVLLLVLRLTVAAGTINGLIFYANIVAVNSAILFQPQTTNAPTVLIAKLYTVFIAWLNLDLGIETCFYNGMDAYVKTWLQFLFPLYVWALVGMIIVGSHYSGRVAKVFGSNPIAVLATLFLLSYAKLLRTVIAALSYTFLEYPNNSHIAVWLYDGNISYLRGKHIPLFTVAIICLIILFFPYMMLLTFSQWLQKFKFISLINSPKVKPFLDAYHAPYTEKHRYWTGLMLLLRFVLFLISAINTLGDPSVNLLAIASTTVVIPTFTTLNTRIYRSWSLCLLETSFILNLTILAVATLYIRLTGGNQNAVTLTSVSVAFVTFTGIVIYHSVLQIKGTRLWRRVCLRHDYMRVPLTDMDSGPEDPPDAVFISGSAPTQTIVDIRNSQLREPCLETD